ncbi:Dihydrodipicolinate synthase/N-acetylneuraminate lyase [Parapedobacter composti]|uniref:Dihydrodipicolinate synthase/N-acetylneuraminate lyase n=1 Tax=Parapedobacter composti TaxID=623281 RepID=A0A1I1E4R4_9SPHI|nr:dihydrodipicolinate synthase family protein [Parapedobacter composti]SFB82229.1 Dihydrodipicolinate synthase/N-acetylneuraminate lyase [Parapedobacter composti]
MDIFALTPRKYEILQQGVVIPAHPLALNAKYRLDEQRQRLLTRYYMAAGAGGIAVGVHSTQFAIREPQVNLFERVLRLAAEEVDRTPQADRFLKIAGICGETVQAIDEAELARNLGYDMGLLSMGGLTGWSETQLLERTAEVAQRIPVFGFYLQPSVGGRILSYDFWSRFVEIPNVIAIKVAAFNRYQTLDVIRAVCSASRGRNIALYTGNDDNIVADLLTDFTFEVHGGRTVTRHFVGGLLGHWAVWTRSAVRLLEEIKACRAAGFQGARQLLKKGVHLTDMNAAIFDPANGFHGCIPGIHEVLKRQGLLEGIWCLDPNETLSPGQSDEITRVCKNYPELIDDEFVNDFLRG